MPRPGFATADQITEIERMIKYILNATGAWAGALTDKRRLDEAIVASRRYATREVIKAIARNPQHGYFGTLAVLTDVAHNDPLPPHEGTPGVPQIKPSRAWRRGPIAAEFAEPGEIDSYRSDTLGLYTRNCGETILHDQLDSNGMPSPVSGLCSIDGGIVKFTGSGCIIPLIPVYTDAQLDAKTPVSYMPTIIKLAPLYNLKEGDNLMGLAQTLVGDGKADLQAIEGGAMSVSPVADVMNAQKAE